MVAARINFQQGAKRNFKPMEIKEKHEHKGKNQPQNSSKGNSSNNKAKEKGVYKGKNRLTPEELERYHKDNQCFKCGEQGHAYQACPQRNARNEQPRASIIEAPKEDVHCKGSPLSYAWGKVREHNAFILFDPGSTHNFISYELAAKLGIQEFEMGDAMKADGAFIGQDASVTPLIGKLRLHIQGYVDKEDFFISPLKHEDVILGAPWFDRLAASIKFPERRISFKFREKNMYIDPQESGNTIPHVHTHAFDKSIKSSIFVYMIFVKDSLSDVNKTQVNESGSQEDLELSKFLNQFQDVFIDDIREELPPKRGDDDHAIELILASSPPNKPPYRVSQAQQEEIMRQVNELVEKGMVRPSSSPFCSAVLLVHKKDGTYLARPTLCSSTTSCMLILMLMLIVLLPAAKASKYTVGGASGWVVGEDMEAWAAKFTFYVGDELYFPYPYGQSSVLLVTEEDYNDCNANKGIASDGGLGNMVMTLLTAETYFFISGHPEQCTEGLHLEVTVLEVGATDLHSPPPPVNEEEDHSLQQQQYPLFPCHPLPSPLHQHSILHLSSQLFLPSSLLNFLSPPCTHTCTHHCRLS
ncbi:hypothetical protein L7F22_056057 [Adiantum nelumboides]|nr:hypothetical protein [Adiantum nelumboides]